MSEKKADRLNVAIHWTDDGRPVVTRLDDDRSVVLGGYEVPNASTIEPALTPDDPPRGAEMSTFFDAHILWFISSLMLAVFCLCMKYLPRLARKLWELLCSAGY